MNREAFLKRFFPVNPWNRPACCGGFGAVAFEVLEHEIAKQETTEQLKALAKQRMSEAFRLQKEHYEAEIKAVDEFN